MSLFVLAKQISVIAIASGTSLGIYFGGSILLDEEMTVYGITIPILESEIKATDALKSGSERNFQCGFQKTPEEKPTALFDCELEKVNFEKDIKHVVIKKTTTQPDEKKQTNIDITALQEENNIFKIKALKSSIGNEYSASYGRISVVRINKTGEIEESKFLYATIKVLFSSNSKGEFFGKANHFLGKAKKDVAAEIPQSMKAGNSKGLKCAWTKNIQFKNCNLFAFDPKEPNATDSSSFENLKFKSNPTSNVSSFPVLNHNHYLIDFKPQKTFNSFDTKSTIWVQAVLPQVDKNIVAREQTAEIEFINLYPVFLEQDKLLIVDKT